MRKRKATRHNRLKLSGITTVFIKAGCALMALQISIFAIVVQDTMQRNPYYVALYYPSLTEYLALSALLLALGILLFETMARDLGA